MVVATLTQRRGWDTAFLKFNTWPHDWRSTEHTAYLAEYNPAGYSSSERVAEILAVKNGFGEFSLDRVRTLPFGTHLVLTTYYDQKTKTSTNHLLCYKEKG